MKHVAAGMALLALLAGCLPEETPRMYQAVTPDCHRWLDGSNFLLPKDIALSAGTPTVPDEQSLDLDLAWFLPFEREISFTRQEFVLTRPHLDAVARGHVVRVERAQPAPTWQRDELPALPETLHGVVRDDQTMYKVTIRFPRPLPERFDFTPPPMIVAGKAYPLRTFTYRWFPDRNKFGLCD